MPDAPTPLDLDAIREALGDRPALGRSAALDLIHEVEVQRILIDAQREAVRILQAARPAPAWDEEVVALAVSKALREHGGWFADLPADEMDCCARTVLAVVRERLPVKPNRETVALKFCLAQDSIEHMEQTDEAPCSRCLAWADAMLDLWPGRPDAEVKAEAWDEAVDTLSRHWEDFAPAAVADLERRNPYREGGAS